jgi:hypothetical protein
MHADRKPESASAASRTAPLASVVVKLDAEVLRPLVEAVVAEALRQLEADRHRLDGEVLAYSEVDAAKLLGLEEHQLRDERRRGRIGASQIVGRRIRYARSDLLTYLEGRRVNGGSTGHST